MQPAHVVALAPGGRAREAPGRGGSRGRSVARRRRCSRSRRSRSMPVTTRAVEQDDVAAGRRRARRRLRRLRGRRRARRRRASRGTPIGWIFLGLRSSFALLGAFADEYATASPLDARAGLPAGTRRAWFAGWTWFLASSRSLLVPLLFPNGRLPAPRWRPVLWACVAVARARRRSARRSTPGRRSTTYPARPTTRSAIERIDGFLDVAASLGGVVALPAARRRSSASVVVRFRRVARRRAAAAQVDARRGRASCVCDVVVSRAHRRSRTTSATRSSPIAVASIPVAVGVAILQLPALRHRPRDLARRSSTAR